MTKTRQKLLQGFEDEICFNFKDLSLLDEALTHSSYVYELNRKGVVSNERLEFLGDVVLSLIVSEYLYERYQDYSEGLLAKMRAGLVSRAVLAKCARSINIGKYLLLGKGEEATGGRTRESILADAFEAIIGAMYLDQDLAKVRRFVLNQLKEEIESFEKNRGINDPKTMLQEITQGESKTLPRYELIRMSGPNHKQVFEVRVLIDQDIYGVGKGLSKKEAEQNAAKEALKRLTKRWR